MAKRYYIIPMAYPATDIERHLPLFKQYGIGVLDIFASVWRAILEDDMRFHQDIANYIARAVKQQWHDMRLIGNGSHEAMQAEIDEMTRHCIDICNDIHAHVLKFMDIVQSQEDKSTADEYSMWGIHGMDGNDVILVCEDPNKNDITNISHGAELFPVQLK